jgi:hypothetical protein
MCSVWCEMSGTAKRENVTTTAAAIAAIDDFNTKDFLFVWLE